MRSTLVIAFTITLLVGCGGGSDGVETSTECRVSTPTALAARVERRIPHDRTSYVQGLLIHDGVLYESAGRYGESRLRALDPQTGELRSEVALPADVFGEGLAVGGDSELVQLTWKEGTAFRWQPQQVREGGEPLGQFSYDGEGWGLTTIADGTLLMSDGSDRLVERDPIDFSVGSTHIIRRSDGPADQLNELEFDGTWVWANRYQSTEILRIDPECWNVTGVVDAGHLRDEVVAQASLGGTGIDDDTGSGGGEVDVLNGIAHIPGGDRFIVTGKWWPTAFEVSFVELD